MAVVHARFVGELRTGITVSLSRLWVAGFYGAWSDTLRRYQPVVPTMLAYAQIRRWQRKYGREPTDQQRAYPVNKIKTHIAMKVTTLKAQVLILNLQSSERG